MTLALFQAFSSKVEELHYTALQEQEQDSWNKNLCLNNLLFKNKAMLPILQTEEVFNGIKIDRRLSCL